MKNICPHILVPCLFSLLALPAARAAGNTVTTGTGPGRSVFAIPANRAEGRDPFYPESTRTTEADTPASHTVEITSLKVPGISGTPGHLLAIINTHTFAVGDEGDVRAGGGTIHLRCVAIQPDAVTVEVNGQTRRIPVQPQ